MGRGGIERGINDSIFGARHDMPTQQGPTEPPCPCPCPCERSCPGEGCHCREGFARSVVVVKSGWVLRGAVRFLTAGGVGIVITVEGVFVRGGQGGIGIDAGGVFDELATVGNLQDSPVECRGDDGNECFAAAENSGFDGHPDRCGGAVFDIHLSDRTNRAVIRGMHLSAEKVIGSKVVHHGGGSFLFRGHRNANKFELGL